ncbi:contactin-associated protein-like 2b isoform X1 [Electrophorus electricus]|uniref:contactin-associated protein-like 2b isoform X1 n=1 Tax=Electrophorus electricus TaxID=8005 RepID=UPI0015CFECF1|nr:contactin-associated protein-like 2b isoform X1 [Electrophorus electricus]
MRRLPGPELPLLLWILNIYPDNSAARSASQQCDDVLATPLPYSAFSSSSVLAHDFGAGYAKLYRRVGHGGWSPLDSDRYQWLQVDLKGRKQITAIATQGRYSSSDWTKQYRLLYSDTGNNWRPYRQDGNIWTFSGNWNSETVARHELQHAIVARYLRFLPLEWSEEGRIGLRLEVYGCVYWADVIGFDGQGVISYRFRQKKMKILKDVISLRFKTNKGEGVLVHGEGQQGDYLTLELQSTKLVLNINLGSNQYGSIRGHTSVSSGSLLDDDHWHSVLIERYRRSVNFTLDQHTQNFRTNGEFDHLDLDYEISFGGMPLSAKSGSGGPQNFIGCMEGIHYNGDNITNLARRKRVDTSSFRNLTYACATSRTFPAFFNSTSTLQLPGRSDADTVAVSLQFRTWSASGLFLFAPLMPGGVELSLAEGKVVAHVYVGQGKNSRIDISSGSGLNDGQWHSVHFLALESFAILTINGDETSSVRATLPIQIRTVGDYHFGGYFPRTDLSPTQRAFQGCMQLIHVDEQLVDLRAVEQGMLGSFENVSLDMCALIDRCVPNHCEHGGRCSQTGDTFKCTCDATGYTGATCHTSVYEQSCEEYKYLGRTSDSYWIDPDGSGPLEPFKVNCDMTEDKVWTTLANDLPAQSAVSLSSDPERGAVLKLNYTVSTDQVYAVTSNAEHCEQYVTYACRMSRLLNSPDGSPSTWWVGRGNEKHFYWGGSGPGIQKCACGIERNCTDPNHYCNCDADQRQWQEDAGVLMYKDHLPVTQVVVGDTHRSGSEAKLTVGPLRCHGDSNYWNAASFNTPASYLHFPTLQGETSMDISFYFKTSSPHGIFLENLGNADFIRLELKSASVVSFSFDVGNGPVELTARSPAPLNDDQWHRVEAERNVKEAVLRLDKLHREVRAAPPQGHTRLELFSQLFVGASGGQRGFLGCIRSLKVNGVTLDLVERAAVTPGVKPGCSGHCSSYGVHCQNGGKCVEKYNGYTCDCSLTAFDGPYCTDDVGGYFESGTLVRYDFVPDGGSSHASRVAGNLTHEELTFSFSTSHAPTILVYVSSRTQDYLAVVLRHNGTLQIRYSLGGLKEPFTLSLDHRNMANGQPHVVNISRQERVVLLQLDHYPTVSYSLPEASDTEFNLVKTIFLGKVFETGQIDPVLIERYNTPGFVGCLSRVHFNRIAPLKAALRPAVPSTVSVQGVLVESNCGALPLTVPPMSAAFDPWKPDSGGVQFPFNEELVSRDGVNRDSAIIGGIIAVVIFTILCTLVFLVRHMFRHKGSYHTNEAKGAESADCADAAIIVNDPAFTETIDESKKEWFI